jgi:asparagine synthase (glutamine-hydrolysing)
MCGIAGIYAYGEAAAALDVAELQRAREAMIRRGPDGAGTWISADRRTGLANRRLSIQDLSEAGAQPMSTPDGRYVITFNGEIYNHQALRRELKAGGTRLRSSGDTEAILHLYARYGAPMLAHLRGMYAFAIWDERDKVLFIARDPLGIKPLYYADNGETLRFASQVKALLAGGAIQTAAEPAAAAGFFLWGCVPEPFTLYRDIRALPAGAYLETRRGGTPRVSVHFSVRDELAAAQAEAKPFSPQDREALGAALRDSVAHHLVSDVPVGVFLSAGVDSALVTALAARRGALELRTLTLGFEEYRGTPEDEVPLAERTAAACGTRHETRWIRHADFVREREAILQAMDQPTTDGVNMYFVCREAARSGLKVALSGLGGDELFGGYPSFANVPRLQRWLRPMRYLPGVGRLARTALEPLIAAITSPKYAGIPEYGSDFAGAYLLQRALFMPWELRRELDPVSVRTGLERLQTLPMLAASIRGLRGAHAKVAALELSWYMRNQLLRDADWAGMAHSLEVRVPLVDAVLFRAMARWLVSAQPATKADAVAATQITRGAELLQRPKSGFAVPVREWLVGADSGRRAANRGLRSWARQVLPPQPRLLRVLTLLTDAFGGHGGIAKFNRDLLTALAAMPECAEVVALPRLVPGPIGALPPRLTYFGGAGKLRYALRVFARALDGPFDVVIASHINLTTLAALFAAITGSRSLLIVHGIDAWTPHRSALIRRLVRSMHLVVGVSKLTLDRFAGWANVPGQRLRLLPNCVDLDRYTPGPKPMKLARELGLEGRTVIMTLGRLASEERYKGFDEVLEALPALAEQVPDIAYLICGEGPDRARLEAKAVELGVRRRVVFTGFVPEESKADYYRLADAYVMPSRGEGFGIVLLEALASGLPVLGSSVDGSREALLEGRLGELVDPANARQVRAGILSALAKPKGLSDKLQQFSVSAFRARVHTIVEDVVSAGRS